MAASTSVTSRGPLGALRARSTRAVHGWVRRRQGPDAGAVRLDRRRIYILPTGLGLAFGVMLIGMLLGSLNYANNLGLALTFLLGALGLAAMHACHANLVGLVVTPAGTEPAHAGQPVTFRLNVANPGRLARLDLELTTVHGASPPVSVAAGGSAAVAVAWPTARRGSVRLARCELATRQPFGLFRAWAVLHPEVDCLVWPRPAASSPPRPPSAADGAGVHDGRGDEDFAGLKDYHPGDPPRHIAWKALARGGELLVKEFAGAAAVTPWFDLAQAPGRDLEQRLEVLTRWVVDAAAAGQAFGLRLPGVELEPGQGEGQRRRCLAALAQFGATDAAGARGPHG